MQDLARSDERHVASVLVVDDDEDIRSALAELLADEGHAVCEAVDGEDAFATLCAMPTLPTLVLLDMMMPRMNGNEFLDAIARVPRLAAIPVVVVSAYAGSVRSGPRRVMAKPVNPAALLQVVDEIRGQAA
jgi:CheY-like chemotaxis protein